MKPDEILHRKMVKRFPDPQKRATALAALDQYGSEAHEKEPIRVRLAILRLSGADLQKIRRNVATAKQDYRSPRRTRPRGRRLD